jgi:hypothetical protein
MLQEVVQVTNLVLLVAGRLEEGQQGRAGVGGRLCLRGGCLGEGVEEFVSSFLEDIGRGIIGLHERTL